MGLRTNSTAGITKILTQLLVVNSAAEQNETLGRLPRAVSVMALEGMACPGGMSRTFGTVATCGIRKKYVLPNGIFIARTCERADYNEGTTMEEAALILVGACIYAVLAGTIIWLVVALLETDRIEGTRRWRRRHTDRPSQEQKIEPILRGNGRNETLRTH
jgi:hypothetical protein